MGHNTHLICIVYSHRWDEDVGVLEMTHLSSIDLTNGSFGLCLGRVNFGSAKNRVGCRDGFGSGLCISTSCKYISLLDLIMSGQISLGSGEIQVD